MNTCKTCKFWRRGGELHWEGSIYAKDFPNREILCKRINYKDEDSVFCIEKSESKMGLCLHTSMYSDYKDGWLYGCEQENEISDGVMSSCDEQRGTLLTGQDFGCIHFSKK